MGQVDAFAHNFLKITQIAHIKPKFVPITHFTDFKISPKRVIRVRSPAFPRSSTEVTHNIVALALQGRYQSLLVEKINVDESAA